MSAPSAPLASAPRFDAARRVIDVTGRGLAFADESPGPGASCEAFA